MRDAGLPRGPGVRPTNAAACPSPGQIKWHWARVPAATNGGKIRLQSLGRFYVSPSESIRKWLFFLLAGCALQASIIKGSVLENQTGKALARTLVSIQPVPGSAGPSGTVRTNIYGMFEFLDLS